MYKTVILLLFLLSSLLSGGIVLSQKEKEYISSHPVIKVHNEMDWAPYNYNKDGKPYGHSIDYIKLVASKVGLKIDFVSGYSWSQFLLMLKMKINYFTYS